MSSWDDLSAKYKGIAPMEQPPQDRQDVWSQLAATHRIPTASITSVNPDNSEVAIRQRRMVMDMPVVDRSLAQLGSGFADVGMAVDQMRGKATQQDVDEKRKMDAALTEGPVGGGLKFAGQTLPTIALPYGFVAKGVSKVAPAVARTVEGAVIGGTQGALQPVGSGESRLFNTLSGATMGTIFPGVAATYRGASGSMTPEAAALAKKARDQFKIPLQASDLTDSSFLKSLNSLYGDLPITGARTAAKRDAKQMAFNRAVGETFGAEGDRLTTDVVKKAKDKMSDTFDDIYSRNPANAFTLNQEFNSVLSRVTKEGTADQQRIIKSRLNELFERIDPNTGEIDGQFFNRWQANLRMKAGNDDLLNEFRSAALKAYNKGVSGSDAELLSKTRGQYKNFKTLDPLLDKATTGDISPGLLLNRVANQTNNFSSGGGGDLADLARIGNRFMVDRTPQTGGSTRGLLQNSLIASGLTLPFVAPAQWAMNNNLVRNNLINRGLSGQAPIHGLLDAPGTPEMLSEIFRRAAIQSTAGAGTAGLLSSFSAS